MNYRMGKLRLVVVCAVSLASGSLTGQQPPVQNPPVTPAAAPAAPTTPAPATPAPATPAPATPAPVAPAPAANPLTNPFAAAVAAPPPAPTASINLQNASLVEIIDYLARQLKINYILDKGVQGSVTINTYGETKNIDSRNLLDLILRINGAAMIQVGDIYRIVPIGNVKSLPLRPEVNANAKDTPEDDRTMLNLVFLKYAGVSDVATLINQFLSEGATTVAYPPANLLLIQDSRRSMKRLLELISLFDSEAFTGQRVKLFDVKEGRPSDISKELEGIFKNIALSDKSAPIKFLPIDRINIIVAIASNPGAFEEVDRWLKKLDVPVQITAGSIDNYVYRVKYGRAESMGASIMTLYGGSPYGGGGGGYPGAYGAAGGSPYGSNAYGSSPYGTSAYGAPHNGAYATTANGGTAPTGTGASGMGTVLATNTPGAGLPLGTDQTGLYLTQGNAVGPNGGHIPRIVPNPLDNSLLIQATPQEYAGILKLLRALDIPPRQVLIDAKVYEVDLTGDLSSGVEAFLQKRGSTAFQAPQLDTRQLSAGLIQGTGVLSMGTLIGHSRELLAFVSASEHRTHAKVISAPSIIATDSIGASITVGGSVPVLSSQSATGVQSGGNTLFANNIQNQDSGTTLNILARVNPSGVVTLVINQEVTAPVANTSSKIDSPSFSKRSIQTQVTLQDGDTIAIAGVIDEKISSGTNGIPLLSRIPYLGAAFGSKVSSINRTELIVFMTPHVIYDTNDVAEASDDLKSRLKKLRGLASRD